MIKRMKKVFAVMTLIVVIIAVGYFVYTGGQVNA